MTLISRADERIERLVGGELSVMWPSDNLGVTTLMIWSPSKVNLST